MRFQRPCCLVSSFVDHTWYEQPTIQTLIFNESYKLQPLQVATGVVLLIASSHWPNISSAFLGLVAYLLKLMHWSMSSLKSIYQALYANTSLMLKCTKESKTHRKWVFHGQAGWNYVTFNMSLSRSNLDSLSLIFNVCRQHQAGTHWLETWWHWMGCSLLLELWLLAEMPAGHWQPKQRLSWWKIYEPCSNLKSKASLFLFAHQCIYGMFQKLEKDYFRGQTERNVDEACHSATLALSPKCN